MKIESFPFVVRPVNYDKEGVNFIVEYLDFSGIIGGGDTIEEALEMAQEGLSMYLEVIKEKYTDTLKLKWE